MAQIPAIQVTGVSPTGAAWPLDVDIPIIEYALELSAIADIDAAWLKVGIYSPELSAVAETAIDTVKVGVWVAELVAVAVIESEWVAGSFLQRPIYNTQVTVTHDAFAVTVTHDRFEVSMANDVFIVEVKQ